MNTLEKADRLKKQIDSMPDGAAKEKTLKSWDLQMQIGGVLLIAAPVYLICLVVYTIIKTYN